MSNPSFGTFMTQDGQQVLINPLAVKSVLSDKWVGSPVSIVNVGGGETIVVAANVETVKEKLNE